LFQITFYQVFPASRVLRITGSGGKDDPISGRNPNRRSTADPHGPNGLGDFVSGLAIFVNQTRRQLSLVEHTQAIFAPLQGPHRIHCQTHPSPSQKRLKIEPKARETSHQVTQKTGNCMTPHNCGQTLNRSVDPDDRSRLTTSQIRLTETPKASD
jgi:hypothetical protein